jgi:hypothetical protein
MPETSTALTNDAIRRQVLLEGVKETEHKKFAKFLRDMEKQIRARLIDEGESIGTRQRLRILLSDVTAIQRGIYEDYTGQFTLDLDDIAVTQGDLEAKALNAAVSDFESVLPDENQLISAYKNNPLSVVGKSQGLTLAPFLKQYTVDQTAIISGKISQGFAEGQTISQIVRALRGTKPANYEDGQYAAVNRNNRIMVRTAVQNAGEQARQRTWDANKDLIKGVEWVPPIHYGCRSTITPVLSDLFDFLDKGAKRPAKGAKGSTQTNANTTYYSWLKSQPDTFQDSVIGNARGKLLRDGGLSSEQFTDLQLNNNFKPMTLQQMQKEAPEAFKQANIKLGKKGLPIN